MSHPIHATLITDFDGTVTANDFYKLAAEHLLPADALTPWQDYRAGSITHFEALRRIFTRINAPEHALREQVAAMQPDPNLADCIADLQANGWQVVVASAGCDWYIRQVLETAGVARSGHNGVEVHANPGAYDPTDGLSMTAPTESPFFCKETGVDKAAIVRFHQQQGRITAFAGDGFADLPAALEVAPERRFARADLAAALTKQGETFRPFTRWCDVATALLAD